MRSTLTALLAAAGVLVCVARTSRSATPPTTAPSANQISGPYVSDNLAVYLIHGPDAPGARNYLTLQEALDQKKVIVREKQQVNTLTIENVSDQDVFVQAGEIVKGGQQDRTLGGDLIVSAHSGEIPILVHCVEHGRWTMRGSEDAHQFGTSANAIASKDMKMANYENNQVEVWRSVDAAQAKLAANVSGFSGKPTTSPTSFELTIEAPQVQQAADAYVKQLSGVADGQGDVIGYVFAINGKLNSGDIYASHALFGKLWPKLLMAAAVEATGDRNGQKLAPPTPQAVAAALAASESATASDVATATENFEQANANANEMAQNLAASHSASAPPTTAPAARAVVQKRESDRGVLYETRDGDTAAPYLHRAFLSK